MQLIKTIYFVLALLCVVSLKLQAVPAQTSHSSASPAEDYDEYHREDYTEDENEDESDHTEESDDDHEDKD